MPLTSIDPPPALTAGAVAGYCDACGWLRPGCTLLRGSSSPRPTVLCLDCSAPLVLDGRGDMAGIAPAGSSCSAPGVSTAALYVASQPAEADARLFERLAQPGRSQYACVHAQGLRRLAPQWRIHWQQLRRWSWLELWWGALLPVLVFALVASYLYQQGRSVLHGWSWPIFVTAYPLFMMMLWRAWNNSRAEAWLREQFLALHSRVAFGLSAQELSAGLETVANDPVFALQLEKIWKDLASDDRVLQAATSAPPDLEAARLTLVAEILALRQPVTNSGINEQTGGAAEHPPVQPVPRPASRPDDLRGIADACSQILKPCPPPASLAPHRKKWRTAGGLAALVVTLLLVGLAAANLQRDVEIYLANTEEETLEAFVDGKWKRDIEPHWVEHFYIANAGRHVIELRTAQGITRWRRVIEFARGSYGINPGAGAWQYVWHEFRNGPQGSQHQSAALPGRPAPGVIRLPSSPDWGPNEMLEDGPPAALSAPLRTWLELRAVTGESGPTEAPMQPARKHSGPDFEVEPNGDRVF